MAEVRIDIIVNNGRARAAIRSLTGDTRGFTGATGKAHQGMRAFNAVGRKSISVTSGIRAEMGAAIPMIQRFAAPMIAAYGLKEFVSVAEKFQVEMNNVSTLVDRSGQDLTRWGRDVIQISRDTGKRSADMARGLYQVISAIGDTADKFDVLEVSAKAATAGITDTTTSVDVITTALNAYGLKGTEAINVSDDLFTAVRLGKTTFPELAASIGSVLPFSSQLKVEFSEVAASIAALTAGGISTSRSATAVRGLLVSFIQQSGKFKEAGVDILKVLDERGIAGALEELKRITGGNLSIMREYIPEVEGLTAALALSGKQAGKFKDVQREMARNVGETTEAFKKQTEGFSAAKAQFKTAFDEMSIAAGEKFLPVLTEVTHGLTYTIDLLGRMESLSTKSTKTGDALNRLGLSVRNIFDVGYQEAEFLDSLYEIPKLYQGAADMLNKGMSLDEVVGSVDTMRRVLAMGEDGLRKVGQEAEATRDAVGAPMEPVIAVDDAIKKLRDLGYEARSAAEIVEDAFGSEETPTTSGGSMQQWELSQDTLLRDVALLTDEASGVEILQGRLESVARRLNEIKAAGVRRGDLEELAFLEERAAAIKASLAEFAEPTLKLDAIMTDVASIDEAFENTAALITETRTVDVDTRNAENAIHRVQSALNSIPSRTLKTVEVQTVYTGGSLPVGAIEEIDAGLADQARRGTSELAGEVVPAGDGS